MMCARGLSAQFAKEMETKPTSELRKHLVLCAQVKWKKPDEHLVLVLSETNMYLPRGLCDEKTTEICIITRFMAVLLYSLTNKQPTVLGVILD